MLKWWMFFKSLSLIIASVCVTQIYVIFPCLENIGTFHNPSSENNL